MEDVEDIENSSSSSSSSSDSSYEFPQAEAAPIGRRPNASNKCLFCVDKKNLESYYQKGTHGAELSLETFLLQSLPELRFVEAIRDWEHKRDIGLIPSKQTAKSLTLHLLNGHFVNRGDSFFYGDCHGSQFKNCVVCSAIKEEVHKVFPNADAEFDRNVQFWFDSQQSSSVVRSTDANRDELRKCIICVERLTYQELLESADIKLDKALLNYFPERPRNLQEMVDGFLVNYILRDRFTNPLTLTKNCFGRKFRTCIVMHKIWERGIKVFANGSYDAYDFAQNWFKEQLKLFEDIKSIAIDDGQEPDTPNVIKIYLLDEDCKKDAATMIGAILEYIFKQYYVGFVLSCGMSKRIPNCLDKEIHDIILGTFPELEREIYDVYVKEWFESKK